MPLNYSHMQLSWNKPSKRNNYVYLYWVTLRNHVADATRNFTSLLAPNTSLVVEALTRNTLYSFDVVAITVFKGEVLNSNVTSITITTQPGSKFSSMINNSNHHKVLVDTFHVCSNMRILKIKQLLRNISFM